MLTSEFKLLHCLRSREYLEAALQDGLKFTDHLVNFIFPEKELSDFVRDTTPMLEAKLQQLGRPPTEDLMKKCFMGLGSIKGMVPMLCFSETPIGKHLDGHSLTFGRYGLVVSRAWMARNGGDRVIYVGEESPVTRHLFKTLALMQIATLSVTAGGDVVFANDALRSTLDLWAYFQERVHVAEAEWRICGSHGFVGGARDTGKRLPLGLEDVEAIFAPPTDTAAISAFVAALAKTRSGGAKAPPVRPFPEQMTL